jgi:uncharacterized protein (TIRG00374 family)
MRRKVIALIGISIAMIIAMVIITDPRKIGDNLAGTDISLVLGVVGLYILNGFVKAARWQILVSSSGGKIPFSRIYLFLLIGLMINNTTPGRVGGEPVRAYLLRSQDNIPMGQGLSTIFVERIVDLIVLTSMALIGIALIIPILLASDLGIETLVLSFIPVIVVIVILIYVATHPVILRRAALGLFFILKKISKKGWVLKAESGIISFVDSFNDGISNMKHNLRLKKRFSITFIILSLIIWLNEAARIYLILLALPGIDAPSFGAVLIASSVATVFGAVLPIGAMHATLISSIFTALGVDMASATTAGILVIMTTIWLSIPLGIIAMFVVGMKLDKLGGGNENDKDKDTEAETSAMQAEDY